MKTLIKALSILTLLTLTSKSYAQPGCCKADAGKDTTICSTGSVTLGGEAPGSDTCNNCNEVLYRWEPSTGLSDAHVAHPVASPSQTTTYTLHIYFRNIPTSDTCCHATSTVTVTVGGNCGVMPGRESWLVCVEGVEAVLRRRGYSGQVRAGM